MYGSIQSWEVLYAKSQTSSISKKSDTNSPKINRLWVALCTDSFKLQSVQNLMKSTIGVQGKAEAGQTDSKHPETLAGGPEKGHRQPGGEAASTDKIIAIALGNKEYRLRYQIESSIRCQLQVRAAREADRVVLFLAERDILSNTQGLDLQVSRMFDIVQNVRYISSCFYLVLVQHPASKQTCQSLLTLLKEKLDKLALPCQVFFSEIIRSKQVLVTQRPNPNTLATFLTSTPPTQAQKPKLLLLSKANHKKLALCAEDMTDWLLVRLQQRVRLFIKEPHYSAKVKQHEEEAEVWRQFMYSMLDAFQTQSRLQIIQKFLNDARNLTEEEAELKEIDTDVEALDLILYINDVDPVSFPIDTLETQAVQLKKAIHAKLRLMEFEAAYLLA